MKANTLENHGTPVPVSASSPGMPSAGGKRALRSNRRTRLSPLSIVGAFGLLLLGLMPTGAQPVLDSMLFTSGTTWRESTGQDWAYLVWQTGSPEELLDRVFAIYQKAGNADAAGNYVRQAIVRRQPDPAAIGVLLKRAESLGDNLAELNVVLGNMFQSLIPLSNTDLATKLAIVIQGSVGHPERVRNLVLLSRLHPGVSLCLGFGHAQQLTNAGLSTFEVRAFDLGKSQDIAVVGRVTVEAGISLVLPAPGRPVQMPDDPGHEVQGHLNARFRWGTSDELRRLSLLTFGFNLYRMTKAFAVHYGYDNAATPPLADVLTNLVNSPAIRRVNHVPLLTSKSFDLGTAEDFTSPGADKTLFFTSDDNRRFDPGGSPFQNGEEFYYFVTARDVLGRHGLVSPGTYVKMCDRYPPPAPSHVAVENFYTFNSVSSNQSLRVTWQPPNKASGDVITRYYVYRWASPAEMLANQAQPMAHRIGTVPHDSAKTSFSFLDQGLLDSPTMATAGQTYWYTVRSEDDGACGGNLSPHSGPVFGVLRDREGPGAPGGTVEIRCCRPLAAHEATTNVLVTGLPANQIHFQLVATRAGTDIQGVEFFVFDPGDAANRIIPSTTPLDANSVGPIPLPPTPGADASAVLFPPGSQQVVVSYSLPRAVGLTTIPFYCRAISVADGVSPFVSVAVGVPDVTHAARVTFSHRLDCHAVTLAANSPELPDCTVHHPLSPGGGVKTPIQICIDLKPGTIEWRLYRSVNGSIPSLLKHGLDAFGSVPNNKVCTDDLDYPSLVPAEVCFYAQLFDEHGNASPMALLHCVQVGGKKPTPVAALQPVGTVAQPQILVKWFCAPYGVARFAVYIALETDPPPLAYTPELSTKKDQFTSVTAGQGSPPPLFQNFFGKYESAKPGPGFGPAQFTVTLDNVDTTRFYSVYVRAIGDDGKEGPPSNVARLLWSVKPDLAGEVTWPALALPSEDSTFKAKNPRLRPVRLSALNDEQHPVGILIGDCSRPQNIPIGLPPFLLGSGAPLASYLFKGPYGLPLFPATLYRYQVPNATFPKVSGDITQVSPLMESIAYRKTSPAQVTVYDPFIGVYPADVLPPELGVTDGGIFLLDTQPVIENARYAYLLVQFREDNKEIRQVIPVGEVEVAP